MSTKKKTVKKVKTTEPIKKKIELDEGDLPDTDPAEAITESTEITSDNGMEGETIAGDAPVESPPEPVKDTEVATAPITGTRDPRLPPVGSTITKEYKGRVIEISVEADGFLHAGEKYSSLSAVARAITSQSVNGFLFFGLTGAGKARGNRLAGRVKKIESLIGKLKAALDDGKAALTEAEAEHAGLTAQAGNQPEA